MWTNTLQQIADGLTKPGARQSFVEVLRRGYHALRYDPSFTAGKKLSKSAVQRSRKALEDAAAQDEEAHAVEEDLAQYMYNELSHRARHIAQSL